MTKLGLYSEENEVLMLLIVGGLASSSTVIFAPDSEHGVQCVETNPLESSVHLGGTRIAVTALNTSFMYIKLRLTT